MAENLVIILKLHTEHRVGEELHNAAAHFKQFFLGQTNLLVRIGKVAVPYSPRAEKESISLESLAVDGTSPLPHPATHQRYPEVGGRVGEQAGADSATLNPTAKARATDGFAFLA
ncbi:hypothetical protein K9B35_16015 [Sphingomonas sp. R647]|uniref:hypothetical protein n=1 Tax=Sphingomonas sp. R647 TaxID=2875233 RepID=UPI001CD72C53|nr:hypothetical protein [Sphingomonas sp. R647]MCA1199476.1 hypothetical protein [Sphingomonas sp. R647]